VIGVAGIGVRALATAATTARAVTSSAFRPATSATRAGLRTAPGSAVRSEARELFETLDAAGARDIERVKARLGTALDSTIDGLLEDVLASDRSKRVVERVLESEQLWLLVERIANSPEVLNAIASTSVGLTGVVADEARRRTVTADEFAERIARRLLRRAPRESRALPVDAAPGEPVAPQA
jgi:hypothetical protein